MKELTDILSEGLIGSRSRNVKSVGEVLWNTFERLLSPDSGRAADELYEMMSNLPGVSKYMGGRFDDRYIKENDPIIISFAMWKKRPGTDIYLGWPKEEMTADIDLMKRKIIVRKDASMEVLPPFVYDLLGEFWIRDAYDSWIVGKDSVIWSVFRDVMMNLR